MQLRQIPIAAMLIVPGISIAASQSVPATLEMSADGEIQIAADGHVSDYRLQSKLPDIVAKLVDHDVRGWLFEPVVVDGAPVVAKTAMHLNLRAEPAKAENYVIRIVNVRFGGPRADQTKPPRYPESAIAAHVGARVILAVRLDDDGNVVDAAVRQTSLDARASSETEAKHFRDMFERASLATAKSWHYNLSESLNGKKIGTVALVPVVFSLRGIGATEPRDGQWKGYVPGPLHPVIWLHDNALANNTESLEEGQAASQDSHFHLKTDVAGKAL
jgi:hypothetical protein